MPEWLNKDTVSIATTIVSLVAGPAVLWWLGRYFARAVAVDDLAGRLRAYSTEHAEVHRAVDARLAAGEREFQGVRAELSRLPQRADMDRLEMGMSTLSVEVATLRATLDAVNISLAGIREGIHMGTSKNPSPSMGEGWGGGDAGAARTMLGPTIRRHPATLTPSWGGTITPTPTLPHRGGGGF